MELVGLSRGAGVTPLVYRRRQPQTTALYQLLETYYQEVKAVWEERFEKHYGFWRGLADTAVARYLDCGVFENGFARVKCFECPSEYLVAFSCKVRGLCPSCGAKRAAAFAAFLKDELLEDVGHSLWTLTLPKMLRLYFLYHRELLGELARVAYETIKELMMAATDTDDVRPGMVAVIQTFGDSLKWNPHIHAVVSRGGWQADGQWIPLPYIDPHAAELLFRHKIFELLKDLGLLSDERIALMSSWRRIGFSVDNSVIVYSNDDAGLERLARYLLRSPVSLQRLHYSPDSKQVVYQSKKGHDQGAAEVLDPIEFIARLLTHIPEPRKHSSHYFGFYANRTARSARQRPAANPQPAVANSETDAPSRSSLRRRWADLIRRVYEIDPLVCRNCGSEMRIVSFITKPSLIRKILHHLESRNRPPPSRPQPVAPL